MMGRYLAFHYRLPTSEDHLQGFSSSPISFYIAYMYTYEQLLSGALAGTKTLRLQSGFTNFPIEIFTLADTLELLDLSGNCLSSLPADFTRFTKLKILFLSDNQFTRFPEVLGQCISLEIIGFKANKITEVPEGSLPQKLRWLILTNNQIRVLPASIGGCSRLQKCMLAGNNLEFLPEEMQHCRNLELLRIAANHLEVLPQWLPALPRLSWLAFAGNPFCQTAGAASHLLTAHWQQLTLQQQLGEGASGTIMQAVWQQEQSSQTVAVKIFKGEVTSDGLPADEMAGCLAAGHHPNLVPVLAKLTGHPQGKQGLVLQLIPSSYRNLGLPPNFATCTRDTFAEGARLTSAQITRIAKDMADVAAHLHSRQVMHGDLYAHNILINPEAQPLFGDFGAATIYSSLHSIDYAAIEKIEVRAFGCLLDELLQLAGTHYHVLNSAELQKLRNQCLNDMPALRPSFNQVVEILANL